MFEGKPPFAPEAYDHSAHAKAGDTLRTLSWTDLVTKLEAARDLRAALAGEKPPHSQKDEASFDASSAHHLAEQQETFPAKSESPVNPLDSGNRKETGGNNGPSENKPHRVCRGRT